MKSRPFILLFLLIASVAALVLANPACRPQNNPAKTTSSTATNHSQVTATNAPIADPPMAAEVGPKTPPPAKTAEMPMPAVTPAAPKNFYPAGFSSDSRWADRPDTNKNYRLAFRAGYQHISYRDNRDGAYVGARFYLDGADWRAHAAKNAWLVPDAGAEISYQDLPKPDGSATPGADAGIRFRADFFWPWLDWTARFLAHTNSVCPLRQPLVFRFGPVAEVGFDQVFDAGSARFARYAGARLTINRSGFIEYTAGGTDGLTGTRQQLIAELPLYTRAHGDIRYVLRGEWNHTGGQPNVLVGGLFLEMPFSLLAEPKQWSQLLPFVGK